MDFAIEHRIGETVRWRVGAYARQDRRFLRLEDSEDRLEDGEILRPIGPGEWRNALEGTARGVELMVQRESPEGLSGWLAYAYGRTRYDDRTTGERFWGDFDQRHAVSLYAQYRLTDRTAFLAKLRAGSNFPIPGYLEQRGDAYFVTDSRNLARLPSYARLDLRANRVFNYDKRRLTLFVEVLNVLNRTNARPSGYFVRPTGEAIGVTETLFPILPSAGILIEF
jgi:TonB dependent receptor